LVFASKRAGPYSLWRIPVSGGEPESLLQTGLDAVAAHFSKSGQRLVCLRNSWNTNLWRVDGPSWKGRSSVPRKVISSSREDSNGDYSLDGRKIVFDSNRSGAFEIWTASTDGSNSVQLTSFGAVDSVNARWSPDGNWIAFESSPQGRSQIYLIPAQGGTPRVLTPMAGRIPTWSRDGKRIYFSSAEPGKQGIFATSVDGTAPTLVIDGAARQAIETVDRKYLIFERGDGVRRRLREGGPEEHIFDFHSPGLHYGKWAVAPQGICFLNDLVQPHEVDMVAFSGGPIRRVGFVGTWPKVYGPTGFAVSPDGGSILYQRVDQFDSEVILIDGVR
jgi:dipeptidyl aminopeptidase/acylaminoacyl peptidase